jgi:hypothetical protein
MSFHRRASRCDLHLRQVVEGAGAPVTPGDLLLGVVEKHQAEVEDAAGDALAVDQHVLLVEVPAARADLQHGDLVVELVDLAGLVGESQSAAHGVVEVHLALHLVEPVRAVGILEVGHVGIGAGVEGVDDHLGLHRAGDLDAAALQRLGQRRHFPVALADVLRLGQEVRHLAGVDLRLALDALGEQFLAARREGAVQLGDEGQRIVRENFVEARMDRCVDLNA